MKHSILAHDFDVESAVIKTALYYPELYSEIVNLEPDDFYNLMFSDAFQVICQYRAKGQEIDFLTITTELKNKGHKNADWKFFDSTQMPLSYQLKAHMRRLRELSNKRKLYNILNDHKSDVFGHHNHVDIMSEVKQKFLTIKELEENENMHIKYDSIDLDAGSLRMTDTGFSELDDKIGGFFEGQFIIMASRPRMGKSTIALQIAKHAAKKSRVLYFSLEMMKKYVYFRMLNQDTCVPVKDILRGKVSEDDKKLLRMNFDRYKNEIPYISIIDNCRTLREMEKVIRNYVMKYEFALVIVDYLQLVKVVNKNQNRYIDIGDISRMFKSIAMELRIPIIALSALGRNSDGNIPKLSDLRESGDLEQDADTVLLLHRDYNERKTDLTNETILIVAKGRDTGGGVIDMTFSPNRLSFYLKEKKDYQEGLYG